MNYLWQFSDGSTSTEATPTHVFSPPGVYSLSLTAISSQYCMDTSKVVSVNSITVNPSPVAGFVATPTLTTIFDPEINFYNTTIVTENIVSWYYNFDDGTGSSEINPFHAYQTWGDFYVTQTVTNVFGCPNTVKLLVRILPEFRFWVPNAFTPDKDGLNDVFKPIVIGVEDYTFLIFDRWGEQIYKTQDQTEGWDGRYKNDPCTDDVYIWKCDFKNVVSKEYEHHVGHVTLVR
jgi:gliding motility-associated-like protein